MHGVLGFLASTAWRHLCHD